MRSVASKTVEKTEVVEVIDMGTVEAVRGAGHVDEVFGTIWRGRVSGEETISAWRAS